MITEPPSPPLRFRGVEHRSRKAFWSGTHRVEAPEATLLRIRPHLARAGVTRLADVTRLDRAAVPVVIAVQPNLFPLASSAGKGLTLPAATVSAAMEAIEVHAAMVARPPVFTAAHRELDPRARLPVEHLPRRRGSLFRDDRPERWILGWDIARAVEVAVPERAVTMHPPAARSADLCSFPMDSNGLASGVSFAEATLSGLLEVIERDAVTLHRLAAGSSVPPRVRLETVEHARVVELIARLDRAEIGVLLCDLTADTEVPVYLAQVFDRAVREAGVATGFGAHLDPEVAMLRAITEAVQARVVFIAGSRDDMLRSTFQRMHAGDGALAEVMSGPGTIDARVRRTEATATHEGDVDRCLRKLARVGIDRVVVIDLSWPEADFSVVRVLVPGLEGYLREGYVPGPRALSAGCAS